MDALEERIAPSGPRANERRRLGPTPQVGKLLRCFDLLKGRNRRVDGAKLAQRTGSAPRSGGKTEGVTMDRELYRLVPEASLKRLLKYIYRFGVVQGLRILYRILARQKNVKLHLPALRAPVFLRSGTSDVRTFEKVFVSEEYEFPYPNRTPSLIIDAGANVGYASIFFANKFPDSLILAVEPESSNYELLLRNTQPYKNITALRGALWHQPTPLTIENPKDEHWAFRVVQARSRDSDTVRGMTVPELMAIAGTSVVDILKVDIEGAEKEVFESTVDMWLDRVRLIVIELHDWLRAGCSTSFYRATSRLAFRQFICGENVVLVRDP